jgi:hypothetical protein
MQTEHGGKRLGAGRPKGSRNKRSEMLIERMEKKFPNWCPVEQLIEIARDENNPIEVRAKCAERVAAYVYAKPKEEKTDLNSSVKDMAELIREARMRAGIMQQVPLYSKLALKQVGEGKTS